MSGEIAINSADGKLFYSTPGGTIKFIENQNTFATVNANSSILVSTSTNDILSILPGNNINVVGDGINKSITISTKDVWVGNNITLGSSQSLANTFVTSSLSQIAIDQFPVLNFRSAKYEVQLTSGSSYHVIELRVLHDGSDVWMAQYGEITTTDSLGNFDAMINGGNLQVLFTPNNPNTTLKFYRNALVI
jgi:hypothetical protein